MSLHVDRSGKQWVSHTGLFPRELQSGTSVNKKTHIGNVGNRYIHKDLYIRALCATRHDSNIPAFHLHLINDNGLTKLQAVCAIMRKMTLEIHALFKYQKPFDEQCFVH